jgi:GxxExxY protein
MSAVINLTRDKQDEITYMVIGCAMEVHKIIGNGFQEVIYQRCLSIELTEKNIKHTRELELPIIYKNNNVGTRRADFLVADEILVEIKAIISLEDVHLAQAMNYLETYNLPTGLLVNFGSKSLQFRRLFNKKFELRQLRGSSK